MRGEGATAPATVPEASDRSGLLSRESLRRLVQGDLASVRVVLGLALISHNTTTT